MRGIRAREEAVTPQQVVQEQFDAYNARDLERFLATFAADACLYRPPAAEPAIAGKEALRTFYATRRFNQPGLRAELLQRTLLGAHVLDHERIHGLAPDPAEMVMAYVVYDGLIRGAWAFTQG